MRRGMRHPEQRSDLAHGQVRPPVRRDQQDTIGQIKPLLSARSPVGDLLTASFSHQPHQLSELAWFQASERDDPFRPRCRDHLHQYMTNDHPDQAHTGLRDSA
jgi:hypothetical protein